MIAAAPAEPSLQDEIGLQRVVNHRLLACVNSIDLTKLSRKALIKLARTVEAGNAGLAQLLRDQQALDAATAPDLFVMEAFLEMQRYLANDEAAEVQGVAGGGGGGEGASSGF